MRRVLLIVLAVVGLVAGGSVVVTAPATAIDGSDATFTGAGQEATLTGSVGENAAYECTGAGDPLCVDHEVTITGSAITLRADLTAPSANDDFDLHVYTGNERVATSGNPSGKERVDLILDPGTYTVQVQPYQTTAGSTYSLKLVSKTPAVTGSWSVPAAGGFRNLNAPAPSTGSFPFAGGCQGNADPHCDVFRVDVPFAGGVLKAVDKGTGAMGQAAEFLLSIFDGRHRLLAEELLPYIDDGVTVNLPGAGSYYVQVESSVGSELDSYQLRLSSFPAPEGGGSPIAPDPGPQPADQGLYERTVGYAIKTGFRGVVAWQAKQPVLTRVRFGPAPNALNREVLVPGGPDTAGMIVLEGLVPRKVYYWQLEDVITGRKSVVKSFAATNAYEDWNGSVYTIDLLVQLDAQSLPEDVPADQALNDISAGMNVFAERVYDATDGFVRVGNVIVTDTNVDYAFNVPNPPAANPGFLACTPSNYADVLVQTTVPFDSHTYAGYAINEPCVQFFVGRIGQLVDPWRDDLHFGTVSSHELSHYAFSAPDLYDDPFGSRATGCANLDWNGSLMHNTSTFNAVTHKWELTEFDRNPTLTPCDHSHDERYTWDTLRARYLSVPLRPDGPIDHTGDSKARGNPDGGALSVFLLDREPGSSTLTPVTPDDTDEPGGGALCASGDPQIIDPALDATELILPTPLPIPNEYNLDVTSARVSTDGTDLVFEIDVVDLDAPPFVLPGVPLLGQFFRFYFTHDGVSRNVVAERGGPLGDPESFSLYPVDTTGSSVPITGDFDDAGNRVTLRMPMAAVSDSDPTVDPIAPGAVLSELEVIGQRSTGLILLTADSTAARCTHTV